ncbi:4'-phosphopantetheine phosphatase-like isoform X1 [Montipora capricornis]|uniref:4'-phosphopantetheine phosphatase-like isoform X1 n=2 Tax=Montipora foliosa TaxID=591990 RepID=UPI0035F15E99
MDLKTVHERTSGYARSISLPEVFRNLKTAKRFAVDIGGSLAKVAYMSEVRTIRKRHYSFTSLTSLAKNSDEKQENGGNTAAMGHIYEIKEDQESSLRLHFIKFETKYIEMCIDFIQENILSEAYKDRALKATGGGAHKYIDLLTSKLGCRVDKEDEMECLIRGCNFLLRNISNEVFEFHREQNPPYVFQDLHHSELFPYLLVNIGSGVSIVKVLSETEYERVGGTSMGGGTFWGLGSLLTSAKGFDELLELATKGRHQNVDMLVRDIYGGAYEALKLPGDLTASSFGKTVRSPKDDFHGNHAGQFAEADVAKSLLHMISNDIGQIASLYAKLNGLKKIYFSGYFIRGNPLTMHTISYGINYWSKGQQQPLFLRHEGYLGAIGAFLKGADEDVDFTRSKLNVLTWRENYAGSSGLSSLKRSTDSVNTRIADGVTYDVLEMDQFTHTLVPFPLLHSPSDYFPDTQDLTVDSEAREYWLQSFEDALEKVVERAVASQPGASDAKGRAEMFRNKFRLRLNVLKQQPAAYGTLNVRSLLDAREQYLNEFNFPDPYAEVKQQENEAALLLLSNRLKELDALPWEQRQLALIEGILAGNVFDWGAREVAKLMESGSLDFQTAMKKLKARPWLRDDLDAWIARSKGPPHKLAVVFVDNSGVDIILGMFPFIRELLSRGTKVVMAANSYPALNDVMYSELVILTESVAKLCPEIRVAFEEKRLFHMESGIGSPCLDFRRVNTELARKCMDADLLILEGMGRAVHTNYDAKFTCESIKLAALKNRWLARRLGGDMYSVVFRYEQGTAS